MCTGQDVANRVRIRLRNGHMCSIDKYVLEQIRAWAVEQYRMGEFDPPWPCEPGDTLKEGIADEVPSRSDPEDEGQTAASKGASEGEAGGEAGGDDLLSHQS